MIKSANRVNTLRKARQNEYAARIECRVEECGWKKIMPLIPLKKKKEQLYSTL